ARRAHGHAMAARGARGPCLQVAQPRGLFGRGRAPQDLAPAQPGLDRRDRGGTHLQAGRGPCRRRRVGSREKALRHLEQDGAEADLARAALRHLRLPHCRSQGRGLLPRAVRGAHELARGAWPLQGLHLQSEAERLPVDPHHQRVGLQIRTERMHSVAEYGVAAHALYKDNGANGKGGVPSQDSNAYRWLRHLVGMLLDGDNPEEFLEHTKLELFQDQVFCFTPKGRLIALPRGANPIDFAYAVHTGIGNTTVGAKINGRPMPLVTELRNGDEVEIICSKAQLPPSAWQSLAVTGKARSAIRRATRDAVRAQYGKLGREILVRAFQRREKTFSEENLTAALPRLSQKTAEDVMAAVGRGELGSADVVRAVFPEETTEPAKRRRKVTRSEEGWFGLGKVMGLKFRWPGSSGRAAKDGPSGIPIRGLRGDLPVNFADGGAVPGDRIVGILNPGQGITIYPIHAEALKAFDEEPERWIDVTWDIDEDNPQRFPAKLAVTVLNEPGSLAQVASVIGEADGNIDNVK